MLEEKDYQNIKELFHEESTKLENNLVVKIGEVIEDNILPALEEMLDSKLANLPDKGYLSDKLADLEGTLVVRQRKEDKKVNLLIEFLKNRKILSDNEVDMLQNIQVFPVIPKIINNI